LRNKFLNKEKPGYHPIRKMRVCLVGLWFAIRNDFAVAYKVALSLITLGLCIFLHDWTDFLTIFLATGLVLVAELFNTAMEALCDYLSTEIDHRIRVIKDVAAAAVGVSILVWGVVLVLWFDLAVIPRIFSP
jgi:diacylglycerol kinase